MTALKEKYMETYQRRCLDEINEDYEEHILVIDFFMPYRDKICHYVPKYITICQLTIYQLTIDHLSDWKYNVADFPKRYEYSSGMNCSNGYK